MSSTPGEPIEPLEYDLTDWDEGARGTLEWMLSGRRIAYAWESEGVLVVAPADQPVVEGFIDYLVAGPEATDWEEVEFAEEQSPTSAGMTIDDFYEANPVRRESEELELGMDWTDDDGNTYELSWVEDTGELFLVDADEGTGVEVLGVWERDQLEQMLLGWQRAMAMPGSVEWVRERVALPSA